MPQQKPKFEGYNSMLNNLSSDSENEKAESELFETTSRDSKNFRKTFSFEDILSIQSPSECSLHNDSRTNSFSNEIKCSCEKTDYSSSRKGFRPKK